MSVLPSRKAARKHTKRDEEARRFPAEPNSHTCEHCGTALARDEVFEALKSGASENEVVEILLQQQLLALDDAFINGDKISGLAAASVAMRNGMQVPPRTAAWLSDAMNAYVASDSKTLDSALGLSGGGQNPRRSYSALVDRHQALMRMAGLCGAGATVKQAALLESRLSKERSQSSLEQYYSHGRYGEHARYFERFDCDLEALLAAYPDTPTDAAKAKAAIRVRHYRRALKQQEL